MQFYVLVLVTARWLRRAHPLTVLGTCIAIAWTWRGVMFALYHGKQNAFGTNLAWLATSQLPGALDEFGFGIFLAILLQSDVSGRMARTLEATRWLWLVATVLIATVTMRFFWNDVAIWLNWKMVVFWRTLLAAACCSAVITMCAINDGWFVILTAPLHTLVRSVMASICGTSW